MQHQPSLSRHVPKVPAGAGSLHVPCTWNTEHVKKPQGNLPMARWEMNLLVSWMVLRAGVSLWLIPTYSSQKPPGGQVIPIPKATPNETQRASGEKEKQKKKHSKSHSNIGVSLFHLLALLTVKTQN